MIDDGVGLGAAGVVEPVDRRDGVVGGHVLLVEGDGRLIGDRDLLGDGAVSRGRETRGGILVGERRVGHRSHRKGAVVPGLGDAGDGDRVADVEVVVVKGRDGDRGTRFGGARGQAPPW